MNKYLAIISNFFHLIKISLKPNKRKRTTVGGKKKEIISKSLSLIDRGRFTTLGISSNAWIMESAKISDKATIAEGVYVGENVSIGFGTKIYPNVTIHDKTILGNNIIVGSGSVIGGDGFGYFREEKSDVLKQVTHIGKVRVKDDVHIGSNVSIDRSSMGDTIIGQGSKVNNNVHIAHNVQIGHNCLIMANVSISGSTIIGDNVVINPQAAIAKHLKIGDNAEVGLNSTVIRDVPPNTRVLGSPAKEK